MRIWIQKFAANREVCDWGENVCAEKGLFSFCWLSLLWAGKPGRGGGQSNLSQDFPFGSSPHKILFLHKTDHRANEIVPEKYKMKFEEMSALWNLNFGPKLWIAKKKSMNFDMEWELDKLFLSEHLKMDACVFCFCVISANRCVCVCFFMQIWGASGTGTWFRVTCPPPCCQLAAVLIYSAVCLLNDSYANWYRR